MTSLETHLFIGGEWRGSSSGRAIDVLNPASGVVVGRVAHASRDDLEAAAQAARTGFKVWSHTPAYDRARVIRKAAELLRERSEEISHVLTIEQGKPRAEARMEVVSSADLLEWFAEEARRTYGRIIPARVAGVRQLLTKEPVGPVAAFTPWNFPISQIARKIGAGLAAGCSLIVKGPEEAPASPAELMRCFVDAGLPAGVLNLVYGSPSEVSEYLIPHPIIRKVSFTGSVPVGKHLASLAGKHMKRVTMELGGHCPVIVMNDADIPAACKTLLASKFRNAGQICIAPTRFMIQSKVYDEFLGRFIEGVGAIKVGDGLGEETTMGPLATARRLEAVESHVLDAVDKGAKVESGGRRIGNEGYFFQPTVLTNVNPYMRVMNEEPFGPIALMSSFEELDEALEEANRLPYGLAAYAWSASSLAVDTISSRIESGMLSVNHISLGLAEIPLGGVKDSGYGSEGGSEAVEAYLNPKFVTHTSLAR
jgi:succinate-semialdehyde dehydrogenase / glutarate-semialdehyde dehydrogenase